MDIPELGTLKNSNKLLGTHGVDGIKTGTTDDAANLLFSADVAVGSSTVTIVGVVLGGANHPAVRQAIAEMIDTIAPGFHEVVAIEAEPEARRRTTTPWGDTATARTAEGAASVVVWSDTPVDVEVHADPVTLARMAHEVGTAVVRAGTQEIGCRSCSTARSTTRAPGGASRTRRARRGLARSLRPVERVDPAA